MSVKRSKRSLCVCVCEKERKKTHNEQNRMLTTKIQLHTFTYFHSIARYLWLSLFHIHFFLFHLLQYIFCLCFTLYFFHRSCVWCFAYDVMVHVLYRRRMIAIARSQQIHSKDSNTHIWFIRRAQWVRARKKLTTFPSNIWNEKSNTRNKKEQHCSVSRWTSIWMGCNCVYTMWAVRCVLVRFHVLCSSLVVIIVIVAIVELYFIFLCFFLCYMHTSIPSVSKKNEMIFNVYGICGWQRNKERKKKQIYQRSKQNYRHYQRCR